jgi:hypothetical protein
MTICQHRLLAVLFLHRLAEQRTETANMSVRFVSTEGPGVALAKERRQMHTSTAAVAAASTSADRFADPDEGSSSDGEEFVAEEDLGICGLRSSDVQRMVLAGLRLDDAPENEDEKEPENDEDFEDQFESRLEGDLTKLYHSTVSGYRPNAGGGAKQRPPPQSQPREQQMRKYENKIELSKFQDREGSLQMIDRSLPNAVVNSVNKTERKQDRERVRTTEKADRATTEQARRLNLRCPYPCLVLVVRVPRLRVGATCA